MRKKPFSHNKPNENNDRKQDKHGLQILSLDDDLFNSVKPESETEESFQELLEESLANKTNQELIKEKNTEPLTNTPNIKTRNRRERFEPQDEIDLHGLKGSEAELKTDFFIRNSKTKGLASVRIIVGKGIHSKGNAVLPDIIESKIIELKRKGQVHSYKWENGKKLKSGALIINLIKS